MELFGIILVSLVIIGLFIFLYFTFKSCEKSEEVKRLRDKAIANYLQHLTDKEERK